MPGLLPYARKTHRLITALQAIGMALGGQAAHASRNIEIAREPGTLLRADTVLPLPVIPPLWAIGVDDWAYHGKANAMGPSWWT